MLRWTISALIAAGTFLPLSAQTGFADFRSTPSGAQVAIDDSLRGVTPLLVTLRVGNHRAIVRLAHSAPVNLLFEIVENEVTRHELTLPPRPSYRNLLGAPADGSDGKVTVWLHGIPRFTRDVRPQLDTQILRLSFRSTCCQTNCGSILSCGERPARWSFLRGNSQPACGYAGKFLLQEFPRV
mgnify:FL=1